MSDPGKYRTRDEIQKMRAEHDCLDQARTALLEAGVPEPELAAIEEEVKRIVLDAAEFAQASPEPDPADLFTDVLAEDEVMGA